MFDEVPFPPAQPGPEAAFRAAPPPPRLVVRGLRKRLGKVAAVDGVDLDVSPGEVLGLVGPNGAGKTTLVRMLSGLLRPDGGDISVDGERDPSRPTVRRRIGLAPQANAVYEELTVAENLTFVGRLHGLGGAALRERVAHAAEFVGLSGRLHDRARSLSGGMVRRLNIGCAIVHDPTLVLLDEPTVGVDAHSREHVLEGVTALAARGRALVYATHHMEEAVRVCTRVVVLHRGRIVVVASVASLLARHGSLEAALFALTGPSSGVT